MKKGKELTLLDYQSRLWANVVHRRSCMSDAQLDEEIIRRLGLTRGNPDQDFFYRLRKETSHATYALQSIDVSRVAKEFEKFLPGLEGTSRLFCSEFWAFLGGSSERSVTKEFDLSEEVVRVLGDFGWVRLSFCELFALFPFDLGRSETFRKELKRYLSYQLTSRRLRFSDGFVLDKLHAVSLLLLEAQVNNSFFWENCWRRTLDFVLDSGEFRTLFNEAKLDIAKSRDVISASIDRRIAELRNCCAPTDYTLSVVISDADAAELNRRGQLVRQIVEMSREYVIGLGNASTDRSKLLQDLRALQQEWQDVNHMLPRGRFGDFWNNTVV